MLRLRQDRLEPLTTRPADTPAQAKPASASRMADSRFSRSRTGEVVGQVDGLFDRGPDRSAGELGGRVEVAARFVHQDRHDGGELSGSQSAPEPQPQRFGSHEVHLGVQPRESFTVGCHGVAVEILQLLEHSDDPVEGAGDASGAVVDALLELPACRGSARTSARPTGRGPRGRGSGGTGGPAAARAARPARCPPRPTTLVAGPVREARRRVVAPRAAAWPECRAVESPSAASGGSPESGGRRSRLPRTCAPAGPRSAPRGRAFLEAVPGVVLDDDTEARRAASATG